MEIFDFSDGQAESQTPADRSPRKRKAVKAAIGFGGLASLAGIGSTLAANITLNQGGAVEFGQGVAQTVACDSDGFNLTPVSYYDSTNSIFRLDYLQVSGVNLTPLGDGYDTEDAGHNKVVYGTRQEAIAAHPGQYYDTGAHAWTNTCDQVVLDFKAYTNDPQYSMNTVDGYGQYYASNFTDLSATTTASPLYWSVNGTGIFAGTNHNDAPANADVALVFDALGDKSNYATTQIKAANGNNSWLEGYYVAHTSPGDQGGSGYNSNSSFKISSARGHYSESHSVWHGYNYEHNIWLTQPDRTFYDPAAGAISKFTVESMKYFKTNSNYDSDGTADTLGLRP